MILELDCRNESLIWLGLYEAETYRTLRQFGSQVRSVVDVGAGAGELSIWALRLQNVVKVVAYDSSPDRWPLLRRNLALNGLADDPRFVGIPKMFLGGSEADDDCIELLRGLEDPILFRIDIDGGEEQIIPKLMPHFRERTCFVLLETHSTVLDEMCFRLMTDSGLECRRIKPAWWRRLLPERRPLSFNEWIAARPGCDSYHSV